MVVQYELYLINLYELILFHDEPHRVVIIISIHTLTRNALRGHIAIMNLITNRTVAQCNLILSAVRCPMPDAAL